MLHNDSLVAAVLQGVVELRAIHDQLVTANNNNAILDRLAQIEGRIIMEIKDATNALNALSTASDSLSLKVDALQAQNATFSGKVDTLIDDTEKLITAILDNVPTVPQELADAVTKAQAAIAAANAESAKTDAAIAAAAAAGDKVDTAVAHADNVLPKPAPAGA